MTYQVIDSDHYQDAGIETMFFPGGEPHAKIPEELHGDVLLFLKLRTWNDVGIAACVINALDHNSKIGRMEVFIPYFPAARQDRSDGLAPLTIELAARLLKPARACVYLFDEHSPVVRRHLGLNQSWMPTHLTIPTTPNTVGVIAPDAGAVIRAEEFRDHFYPEAELITCSKKRDSATGKLSGYQMQELQEVGNYVIVDDICDGGGTFNLLAEAFKAQPVSQHSTLELFVSHGIFSKGLSAIDPHIERITTTDSWCVLPEDKRLRVLPLKPLFNKIMGES